MSLLLLLGALAHAETPLLVVHLDPGAAVAPSGEWGGAATAKLEFPIAWFLLHTVPTAIDALGGRATVDEVLEPSPPISPQYTMFARRGFGPDDSVEWGGGMGLRFRPLAQAGRIVPRARGLWLDVNGRYGTAGWGVDGGLGWDVPVSPVVALGPSVGAIWEGGAGRIVAGLSVSFTVDAERLGGTTTISTETPTP